MPGVEKSIFRKGSTTYYWSSIFFPRRVRSDVVRLYSFVRVADDYVDSSPAKLQEFFALRKGYEAAVNDPTFDTKRRTHDSLDERVVKNMVATQRAYGFDPAWVTAFLDSMQADVEGRTYKTMDDTLEYIHGSAEVVGLMMASIFGVDRAAYDSARKLGRAMQYINFIRDVSEDTKLGRCYFPQRTLRQFGLPDLSPKTASGHSDAYTAFIRAQIDQYKQWQYEAEQGFKYLPSAIRVPVKTASDMYGWAAEVIAKDPIAAYQRQVKPHKLRVTRTGIANFLIR